MPAILLGRSVVILTRQAPPYLIFHDDVIKWKHFSR